MKCTGCQHENPAGVRFCGQCGAHLEVRCPACRASNPAANRFCYECGQILETAAKPDHVATASIFVLLTFRPDFRPPWSGRDYLTQLTVSRFTRKQTEQMIDRVAGGQWLPAEVVQQVVAKTDGVPLFVEELTKMVLESGLLREQNGGYELTGPLPPVAIPATLQDSLMARLDRLASVKDTAQLGATIGRVFSYELLRAVSAADETTLQQALAKLIEAEQGFASWAAAATFLQGWEQVQRGTLNKGVEQMIQGLQAWKETSDCFQYWHALLAEGYARNDQVAKGLAQLDEGFAVVERSGEGLWEAELHRVKGELLLKCSVPDEHQAEIRFHQALAIARRQQAKSLELRAAMSLGRPLEPPGQTSGSPPNPLRCLRLVHFHTRDLQAAKALLVEL